ncbi:type II toxin-antitoxin system antitoxin, partial [Mycobacterium tuberculosis]|nr:type II toxin-antitoxin system antitoxin [Mycobacterium tuberculosis]
RAVAESHGVAAVLFAATAAAAAAVDRGDPP